MVRYVETCRAETGQFRSGEFTCANRTLHTPAVTVACSSGFPPFISLELFVDLVKSNNEYGICLSTSFPSVESLHKQMAEAGGLRSFYNLGQVVLLVTPRDALCGYPPPNQLKGDKVSLKGPTSHIRVTAATFADTCKSSIKPDVIVGLHEAPALDKSGLNVEKYLSKVEKRTSSWFEEQLKRLPSDSQQELLLPIVGQSEKLVTSAISALQERKELGVAYMQGVGVSPSDTVEFGRRVAQAASGLRCAFVGCGGPRLVLELFRCGFDIVDTAFPVVMTQVGHALTFSLGEKEEEMDEGDAELLPISVNSRSKEWETDNRPISADCSCFTCRHHTRSYLSHLIHCKEILGEALLFTHNQQRMLDLCRAVREKIQEKGDALDKFIAAWERKHGSGL